jgi:hypothetical protein
MYTLHMTWPFRGLAISVAMVWALVPQLACFMPDLTATPAEMECCKEMMNDCSGMNMSHDCCRTPAHPEVGIIAKATRINQPHMAEAVMLNVESSLVWTPVRRLASQDTHAPPHGAAASPLVLRI